MVKITGDGGHRRRLQGIRGQRMVRKVGTALFAGGQAIQVEAQISITTGAVSGKGHVPSSPGEPPNQDTGVLADNIETAQVAPLKVEVSSNAPYAAALEEGSKRKAGTAARSFSAESKKQGPVKMEYGDSTIAARPYMAPATAKKREKVTQLVRKAVDDVLQTSKGA